MRDEFVDPEELAKFYVQPHTQDRNPADARQDDLLIASRQPALERVHKFFRGGPTLEKDGRHQMFILSDAGMGKKLLRRSPFAGWKSLNLAVVPCSIGIPTAPFASVIIPFGNSYWPMRWLMVKETFRPQSELLTNWCGLLILAMD